MVTVKNKVVVTSQAPAAKEKAPAALVVQVGSTELRYHLRCIDDLHAMLKQHGDWMSLGNADEQKPATPGTVEAWARAAANPVGGWLCAARAGSAWVGRGGAQRQEQPDARALMKRAH